MSTISVSNFQVWEERRNRNCEVVRLILRNGIPKRLSNKEKSRRSSICNLVALMVLAGLLALAGLRLI